MFGENLKSLRKENNITQKDLAEILNVQQSTISLWETNASKPSIDIIEILCKKFGFSSDELIFGAQDYKENECKKHINRLCLELGYEESMQEILKNLRIKKITSLVRTVKGKTFIQKFSEAWNGNGERMLVLLYYFILYINKIENTPKNKQDFIDIISDFTLPKKIEIKHLLALKKDDMDRLVSWVLSNLDDLEIQILFNDLKEKVLKIIEEELNFTGRIDLKQQKRK
ncbi:TPA: helix-turn-helix transcriptional regulator [Campylobacter lari]|nr:helix-turn-helix transcriptional regulator [Campylobacter lari]